LRRRQRQSGEEQSQATMDRCAQGGERRLDSLRLVDVVGGGGKADGDETVGGRKLVVRRRPHAARTGGDGRPGGAVGFWPRCAGEGNWLAGPWAKNDAELNC
jgi:hypothetical protein